jgi:3-oxoadipate enol-lactonase
MIVEAAGSFAAHECEGALPVIEQTSTSGFADIAGAQIYYQVAGEGHPLLLLHAGVADSRMWDDQWQPFARRYRTIRYDMPGFGQSRLPDGSYTAYEDPAGLLRLLGVERAHVVGISWGGRTALDFTLAHPEMVSALVLVCPSVGGEEPSEEIRRFGAEEDALVESGDLMAAAELNVRMWVDGPRRAPEQVDQSVRNRVREMQHLAFTIPMPEGLESIDLEPPALARLAEVHAPTLVVVGDQDIDQKLAIADQLAAKIPGARKVVFPGAAHMVTMEQPAEFNRVVLDFLSQCVS